MKKLVALSIAALSLSGSSLLAQANPRGEAKVSLAGKSIAIEYGRPSLKGRDMLGQAAVGEPWRLGADRATTLKTEADLSFGSTAVPKGEYVLTATKLDAASWRLNLADKEGAKVAEVPLTASKLDQSVETFTIDLSGDKGQGTISFAWGDTSLKASFSAK
jgi:hypothetical protein